MLACTFDPSLGGGSFDIAIAQYFVASFNKPGSDITQNQGSWIRLLAEVFNEMLIFLHRITKLIMFQVEQLKCLMSDDDGVLPINVQCLLDDREFSAEMER